MSYSTYKSAFTTVLSNAGYSEIPRDKEPDSQIATSFIHKGYSFKWKGMGQQELISDTGFQYTHIVELKIGYNIQPAANRDINAGLFETLIRSFATNVNFNNFIQDSLFEDIDETRQLATAKFYIGEEAI